MKVARPDLRVASREGYYANQPNVAPGPEQPVQVNDVNNRPPIPINQFEAQYSEEARKAKWGGTVLLGVEIDESGRVTQVRVVKNLGLGLDEKAIEAATKWRFVPALKDGNPVASEAQIEMVFRLL